MTPANLSAQFGDTTHTKVFVGGLAWKTQKETMKKYFEQFGEILEAVVITDKTTGRSKGYGFVTFREPEAAMRACVDAFPMIDGRRANCNLASLGVQRSKPSTPKHGEGGGGGGRNFRVTSSFQTGGYGSGLGTAFPSATAATAATFPHYAIQQGIPSYNVYGYSTYSPYYTYPTMDVGPSQPWSVTVSNRRLCELENAERGHGRVRVHDDDAHIAMDNDPIHDVPVMDDIAMDDDPIGDDTDIVDDYILIPSFPGGPSDLSILKSFRSHVAAAICNGADERGPLKCRSHSSNIRSWPWWKQDNNAKFVNNVEMSRLLHLVHCTYRFVNKNVVSSLVERWHPETNTFHLPVGEMTITLDDVATILGLSIVGKSISVHELSENQAISLVVNTLKIDEKRVKHEMSRTGGNLVRLEWLRAHFHNVTDNDSMERIACASRAYLLFLLGCTLFNDKTGTSVPVAYLSLLSDLMTVSSYAWGAAALAYLYRQLGYASRSGVKHIAGYMTLLEGWIYEHFCQFQPPLNENYTQDKPHVYRWTSQRESDGETQLQDFRKKLNELGVHDVIWDPYQSCRDVHPCHPVTFFHGCLKCLEVVEPYHPDRVLRQFGKVQTIPNPPIDPMHAFRGATALRYNVTYVYSNIIWEAWHNNVLSESRRSKPVEQPWDADPSYKYWYKNITCMYVQKPARRSQVNPNIRHYQYPSQDAQLRSQVYQITRPLVEAGYDDSIQHPDRLYWAIDAIEQLVKNQHSSETASSTSTQRELILAAIEQVLQDEHSSETASSTSTQGRLRLATTIEQLFQNQHIGEAAPSTSA